MTNHVFGFYIFGGFPTQVSLFANVKANSPDLSSQIVDARLYAVLCTLGFVFFPLPASVLTKEGLIKKRQQC